MSNLKYIFTSLFLVGFLAFNGCDSGGGGGDGGGSNELTSIVVIGDSIATGFGVATGFPVFLRQMTGVPVNVNAARTRQTSVGVGVTPGMLARFNPSHLVILMGTNDALFGSVDNAINNLQTMVNMGRDAGATVVVANLPIIPRDAGEDAKAAAISAGISGLSGARIVDIRSKISRANFADGIHPNNDGQRIIAMEFAEAL